MPRPPSLLPVALLVVLLFPTTNTAASSLSSTGPHIADVNILLPPKMTHPVEYRLQGSDGCFKWSWDHHDILAVLPEYNSSNHCSTSARLKSIAPYSGRTETAVYATDVNTGMVIRCKVYIDIFSRIQIFHNSVKLDLDGLATLRVRAFDSEDNVFSSLVGLQFMWQLMPETDASPHHLVHVPLKDSPLSDCGGLCGDLDIQVKLEDSGVFSDLYVVKGTEIGHEIVSVHLIEPSFEHMADKIVITVAEAMFLDPPSPVFVLIGAVLRYTLKVIRGNLPQVVTLPSPFHRWSVLNSSIAQVDKMTGKAYALNLGATAITVEDTRVAGHIQVSSLHVVLPDSLLLYILPLSVSGNFVEGTEPIPSVSRWYVVSGRQYLIDVKVFSRGPGAREIYITENDDIKLHDDQSEFWKLLPVSDSIAQKGNSKILQASSYGLGKLTGVLTYSNGQNEGKEVLKVVQEIMVCNQVRFSMDQPSGVQERILLPWAPGVQQELELRVTGGCAMISSDYKWFSSDMAIVSVSASGIVQAKKPGKVTIRAVSIFDSFNYDELEIEVSIPSSMVMLPNFPVEIPVGSHVEASVTLKAPNGYYYYRCDAFSSSVSWKTETELFTIVNSSSQLLLVDRQENLELHVSSYGPPCARTYIYASSPARTMLHATLTKEYQRFDDSAGGFIVLKASSGIAAYLPLILHQVSDGNQYGGYWFDLDQAETHNQLENLDDLYLVPGTHLDVMLRGGPERWDQGVEYIETVEILDEMHSHAKDGVLVHQLVSSSGHQYRIQCKNLGTFNIIFKRGNLIGEHHPLPAVSEVPLSLRCSLPTSIALIADEAVNAPEVIKSATQAERTEGSIRATPVTVANGRVIRMSAVGISNSGKAFGNSSSLFLKWYLSNCDGLAFWDEAYNLAITKSSWEKFLGLQNASGLCIVRATVVGFIDSVRRDLPDIQFEGLENALTDAIRLQLVSSLTVSPEFSLLFFNPDAKLNLSVTGGSCFLDTLVNDTQILKIVQPPVDLQCLQLVLAPKRMGTALVTVHDIGLAPPLAAASVVQVVDVDWINITSGAEISLMKETLHSMDLLAGIDDGKTFDSSQYTYMNIRVHIEDPIVELVDSVDFPSPYDGYLKGPNFTIRAKHLGITTLYVTARQHSGHEIASQPIKVEVYAPPRLHPSDIFIVPGASYVLTVRGGPTFGASVKYASMNDETAKVHTSTGQLSAVSPGNTTIVATIYGKGDIMICQAYSRVKVGIPASATLNVQGEQLAVGRKMPIYPSMSEGNLFSFYELCKNYEWAIEDEEVFGFQEADRLHGDKHDIAFTAENKFKSSGRINEQDLGFYRVLYGRSAGKTNVKISFSCDFGSSKSFSRSRLYSASVSLWVVPDLPLALGSTITWILPPHYSTSDLLPSYSNPFSRGDAPSRKGTITYSILGGCKGKMEEVQNDAILIDGGKIRTKESNSLACIQAKDRLTGRIEVASCVRVAEVAQLRISAEDFLVHTLAVGAELDLPIRYYDILGNPFHEAYQVILFEAQTNYPDVVSIEDSHDGKGNIHLRGLRHGKALVQVGFSNNPQKSDYVMILVGPHLYPQNPMLYVGSGFNFSIEGLNDQISGQWLSANGSVVSVDMLSGKAEAIGEGTADISFESSSFKLQTTVTVLEGKMLSVGAPKETLTNVPFPAKGYNFSLKFHDVEAAGNHVVFLFDCRVDPPYIGFAKPWRDLDTGNSYCLFFPYSPEHLASSAPKTRDLRQDVSVSVSASLRGDSQISGSASALFVGGFTILEMDKDSMRLTFTPASNRSVLTIVGNTDIEIHWHDRDKLAITPIYGEHSGTEGRAEYEVKVRRAERFKDKLIIRLPATGQRAEVDVSYEPEEKSPSTTSTNLILWAIIAGCFTLLILTVTSFICFLDRPDRPRPPVAPSTPNVAAPATPERPSPAVVNDQSPRTPQPFIDYIRRTIDDTPYYRQDFRRRANPQHTY